MALLVNGRQAAGFGSTQARGGYSAGCNRAHQRERRRVPCPDTWLTTSYRWSAAVGRAGKHAMADRSGRKS